MTGDINNSKYNGIYKIIAILDNPDDLITLVDIVSNDSYTNGNVPYKFKADDVKKYLIVSTPKIIKNTIKKKKEM